MTYTIVLGVDGSPSSYNALVKVRYQFMLHSKLDIAIHLVAALPKEERDETLLIAAPFGGAYPIVSDALEREIAAKHAAKKKVLTDILAKAEKLLCEGCNSDEIGGRNIIIIPEIAEADPGEALVAVAEKHRADLVVIGSRGLGTIQRFLKGSVSNYVTHHAACDVLVVKQSAK